MSPAFVKWNGMRDSRVVTSATTSPSRNQHVDLDTTPKKLLWDLTPELRVGIRFAETRLSDLICQNDCQVCAPSLSMMNVCADRPPFQALEFSGYGKNFITSHGFSPDAFVQMAFQAAYFGLYGRIECTYEPAMTKAFLHGRTEAIRTVQKESVEFTKVSLVQFVARPLNTHPRL